MLAENGIFTFDAAGKINGFAALSSDVAQAKKQRGKVKKMMQFFSLVEKTHGIGAFEVKDIPLPLAADFLAQLTLPDVIKGESVDGPATALRSCAVEAFSATYIGKKQAAVAARGAANKARLDAYLARSAA